MRALDHLFGGRLPSADPGGSLQSHALSASLILVAIACAFQSVLLSGVFAIADDTAAIQYPFLASLAARGDAGSLPSWSPELLLGYPALGSIEIQFFSPFHWPFLVLPVETAELVRFLAIHAVSALAMYALGLGMGLSRGGAVTAALVWSLYRPAVYMLYEPRASASAPWLPLALLFWLRAWQHGRLGQFLALGGTLGLVLLGGHVQHLYWFGLLLLAHVILVRRPWNDDGLLRRGLVGSVLASVVAVGLAAVQVLPTRELARESLRVSLSAEDRLPADDLSYVTTLRLLPGLLFPSDRPPPLDAIDYEYGRLGVVPVALGLLAWGRRRDRLLLLLAAGFLALGLGMTFPPTHALHLWLPGNVFRYPDRAALVSGLLLAFLAGRGRDRLVAGEVSGRGFLLATTALALLALPTGLALLRSGDAGVRVEVVAGLGALAFVLIAQGLGRRVSPKGRCLLAALPVCGLVWHASVQVSAISEEPGRLLLPLTSSGPSEPQWQASLPLRDAHGPTRVLCVGCGDTEWNLPLLTGHRTPTGYLALRPRRVERLVYGRQRLEHDEQTPIGRLARNQVLLNLLGVSHLAVRGPTPLRHVFKPSQLEGPLAVVSSGPDLSVLENRAHLPRAFFVSAGRRVLGEEEVYRAVTAARFDPRREVVLETQQRVAAVAADPLFQPAQVLAYEPERVEVSVRAERGGWLVLLDRFDPGWSCELDGRSVPIVQANYLFRAVAVPAGESQLVFRYENAALRRGAWLSLATLLGLTLVGLGTLRQAARVARASAELVPERPIEKVPCPGGLSIVVPAFDEEASLAVVVEDTIRVADATLDDWEILIVDDASRDATPEIARRLAESHPRVRVVRHETNQGSGGAILTGIAAANRERVMYVPADGQFHLAEIGAFVRAMEGHDIVIGARIRRSDYSAFRLLSSWVFIRLVNRLFDQHFRDVNWVHMWRRRVFDAVQPRARGVFLLEEILVRARHAGFTVTEVDSFYIPRLAGQAKGSNLRTILRTLLEMGQCWWELRGRPKA